MVTQINPSIIDIVRKYLMVLRENNINFDSAYLFGSSIGNEYNEDSDIDVAIVMNNVSQKFFMEVELMKYRRNIDLRIEPHIITADESISPLSQEIIKTGIKIL